MSAISATFAYILHAYILPHKTALYWKSGISICQALSLQFIQTYTITLKSTRADSVPLELSGVDDPCSVIVSPFYSENYLGVWNPVYRGSGNKCFANSLRSMFDLVSLAAPRSNCSCLILGVFSRTCGIVESVFCLCFLPAQIYHGHCTVVLSWWYT